MLALFGILLSAPARAVPDVDAPLKTGASAPNDAAVVIGVERYGFLAPVPHAARDARALYHLLVYTRGVPLDRVELLTAANREQILAAVGRARDRVGPGGTVWIGFAGHGATSPTTGELLLVGDDAKPDPDVFVARSVPISALQRPDTVLILDTCQAGRARDGTELLPGTRFAVPAYAGATASGGGAAVVAARPEQLAEPYPAASHGLFTYFFTGALRGWADGELDGVRDGRITLREAHAYTARAVATVHPTGQQPAWTGADRVVIEADPAALEAGPDLALLPKVGEPEGVVGAIPPTATVLAPPEPTVPAPARPAPWRPGRPGTLVDANGAAHPLGEVVQASWGRPGVHEAWRRLQVDATLQTYGASAALSGGIVGVSLLGLGTGQPFDGATLETYGVVAVGTAVVGTAMFVVGTARRPKSRDRLIEALNAPVPTE